MDVLLRYVNILFICKYFLVTFKKLLIIFNNIGTFDGTPIHAVVLQDKQVLYLGQKGYNTQNVRTRVHLIWNYIFV